MKCVECGLYRIGNEGFYIGHFGPFCLHCFKIFNELPELSSIVMRDFHKRIWEEMPVREVITRIFGPDAKIIGIRKCGIKPE